MGLVKFILSKTFLKQIGFALIATVVLIFILLQWLKVSTNHNDYITVPDLTKKTMNEANKIINESNLRLELKDSTDFNPKFPRFSVVEQNPPAGGKVKKNRKIYVILNPSGYRQVTVPDVIQVTRRNAESKLLAVGLIVDKVTYIDRIGEDMVFQIKHNGKYIVPGDHLTKTSKVELICGNGKKGSYTIEE
ncbi:PASTA domain-containing protein [Flavobacteriaceae bacterium R38]|nr:PASTA domain-containing protein [Flavobacteriaceae bacterium R38]